MIQKNKKRLILVELNEINYLLPKKKPVLVEKKDLSENDEKKDWE